MDMDEPEDASVVRQARPEFIASFVSGDTRGQYATRHPGPEDVALVVEIADTSLSKDRGEKLMAYARGGVPIYWIVNLMSNEIEVYSEPDRNTGRYTHCVVYAAFETVPLWIDGAKLGGVALVDVLPDCKQG
jgi:Uma2 family endonuclease